jgi:spermidine/putrescine transport system permease protein
MRRPRGLTVYSIGLLVFLFAPTVTVLIFSFDGSGRGSLPMGPLSLRWYREAFGDSLVRDAFVYSAEVAVVTAVVAAILGTLAALALFRHPTKLGGFVIVLAVLPLALPPLVLGIALLSMFKVLSIPLSLWTVIVGHLLITIPIVLLTVNARLSNYDASVEEAARDLGATPLQVFRLVTFPLIRPSIVGASLLVLALSLDEFIITFYTIGPTTTVPLFIWGQMRRGISPEVNAISTVLLLVTLGLVLLTRRLGGATLAVQSRKE